MSEVERLSIEGTHHGIWTNALRWNTHTHTRTHIRIYYLVQLLDSITCYDKILSTFYDERTQLDYKSLLTINKT